MQEKARKTPTTLEAVVPGLWASMPQELPFARTLDIRAFLIEREAGNFLIYSVAHFEQGAPDVEALGGIERQYLNHWHETIFAAPGVIAAVHIHADDQAEAEKKIKVAETFSAAHEVGDDFRAIPIPGHTPGATAYLAVVGGHRALFTGDSVYLSDGEWVAAVLESSDRERYVESLETLLHVDFDMLVPWAATKGEPCFAMTDKADRTRRIGAIIARLKRGEDR